MLEEYVGHWPVWIECIKVHNLKFTRRSTENQWSCLRAGVMCSFIRRSRISRAAAFRTRWRAMSADLAERLNLSCRSQASKERTSGPAERRVSVWRNWRRLTLINTPTIYNCISAYRTRTLLTVSMRVSSRQSQIRHNPSKAQVMWLGAAQQMAKVHVFMIQQWWDNMLHTAISNVFMIQKRYEPKKTKTKFTKQSTSN